jgi:flavin-dependent dehydrogenase
MFRLHPQISKTGMLWAIRGQSFFNIGYVSLESYQKMSKKFKRILQNYQPISSFFSQTSPNRFSLTSDDFFYGKTSKYPISQLTTDRCAIIGDAGGLLYPLYLEGVIGATSSAVLLAKVLSEIQQAKKRYNRANLLEYESFLYQNLIGSYFRAGRMGDALFIQGGDKPPYSIWDTYVQIIHKNQQVRKNIYTAYVSKDLEHYPIENDYWCGEQIFNNLPLGKRIAFTPIFIKTKLLRKNKS